MHFDSIEYCPDVLVIDIEPFSDERGLFARTFCLNEFEKLGLSPHFIQQNISFNREVGTIRGMHYQEAPFAEEKLIRVTSGSIFDVVVDIRPESKNFRRWFSIELSATNRRQIYIPKGFAHGFQTLEPNTELFYQMTAAYNEQAYKGFRWDDPLISIQWPPCDRLIINRRDLGYKYL